jgi:uncharacterized protein YjiS (DUF1127 family)
MAMTNHTHFTAGISGSFVSRMLDSLQSFTSRIQSRSTLREISELDEHLLRDIGLTRDDVRDARMAPISDDPISLLIKASRTR